MAVTYAGILGTLASTVVLLRSVKEGGAVEPAVVASLVGLIAFAALGFVVGRLALASIEESVRRRLRDSLIRIKATDVARRKPAGTRTN